jgi:arginine exporter protein ArgO
MTDNTPPPGGTAAPDRKNNPTDNSVQRTRSWTGMLVVAVSDVLIVVAAVWGIIKTSGAATSSSSIVAILTAAFTAIATMTTAYFGIKSVTNTAQSYASQGTSGTPTGSGTHTVGAARQADTGLPPDGQ